MIAQSHVSMYLRARFSLTEKENSCGSCISRLSFFTNEPLSSLEVSPKTSTSSVEKVGFCWMVDNRVFEIVDLSVVVVRNVVVVFGFRVVGGESI